MENNDNKDNKVDSWMFINLVGNTKGPIPTTVLLKLLEKGMNISGDTSIWREGMTEWNLMRNVEPFSSLVKFLSKQWYYLDHSGNTKGPIITRNLIHKLKEGEIDGMTMIFGEGMEKWSSLSDISELKDAALKVVEEEQHTQAILSQLSKEEDQQHQVFIDDDNIMLPKDIGNIPTTSLTTISSINTSTSHKSNQKKSFTADNGVKYMWDDTIQDWVEDDTVSNSGSEDNEDDDEEEDDDYNDNQDHFRDGNNDRESNDHNTINPNNGKDKNQNQINNNNEKKRKRKKKKKDTTEWKESIGSKLWIYIQGLPSDITTDELKSHFSKVGLIALNPIDQLPKIKLYKDEFGNLKGDASICYNAPESVEMAINIFDGGYIRPNTKPISVSHAEFQKKETISSGVGNDTKRKKGKVSHAQVKVAQNAMAQALAWNENDDLGVSKKRALKIVVIEGMFHPSECEGNDQFFEELEKDIASEFEKCGPVEKITVFSQNPKGVVIVKFATSFAAQECIRVMDGRYFGGRKLRSMFWDGITNYSEVNYESANFTTEDGINKIESNISADDKRLQEFGDWLEKEQEELPEEFRLRVE